MNLALKKVSGDLVYINVSGMCRDSFAGKEENPLSQIPMEDIYQHRVLVNMEDVSFLNSNGVGWLLVCHKRCREAGGQWILHSVPASAMKVLRLMRLHEVLDMAEGEQEAAAVMNSGEISA